MKNALKLVRENILALTPYSTARDEFSGAIGTFLDANESPYETGYNRYPDPRQSEVKALISKIKGVKQECIFVGNGSDEAIDLCFRVFCRPQRDNVVVITPTYGMYSVAAHINDVEVRSVQLEADFSLDTERVMSAVDADTKLIFLCSPNNPTGNSFPRWQIEQIIERFDGIVVLDEAYIDFSTQASFSSQLGHYPNLILLQTLSKAYGLAGLRLGLMFAAKEIVDIFSAVKYPYNINVATQRIVCEQLREPIAERIAEICQLRDFVARELASAACVEQVYPSDANFVLVKVKSVDALYRALIAQGVIVRNRSSIEGCANTLRITIGTREESSKMLNIIANYNG